MVKETRNISNIISNNLCTGCGACYAFCPKSAINLKFDHVNGFISPEINDSKCINCGLCQKICPGFEVDFGSLNKKFLNSNTSSILGTFLGCYHGHLTSINSKLNDLISSGGIVTQLLIFALKKGLIDGALVTRMNDKKPLFPEVVLATTVDEIISSAGSKYCPCPSSSRLKEILNSKDKKFAVVGVPCQIHALRKAQIIFPDLRNRIPLVIGLFCAHATTTDATNALIRKFKLEKSKIRKLTYRGHGWPGSLSFETTDGKIHYFSTARSFNCWYNLFDSYFFVPWSCMFCQDHFNQLSDLSVGDAWIPEFRKSPIGQSLVVIRSELANQLFQAAASSKVIASTPIDPQKVIESQIGAVRFKNRDWNVRMALVKKMGKPVPSRTIIGFNNRSIGSYIINIFRLNSVKIRKTGVFKSFLSAIPLPVYRIYNAFLIIAEKIP